MKHCADSMELTRRLRRIEGQVRGIIKMVEEDKPCEEILIQIGSIKAALHKAGQRILEGHLHHCVLEGIKAGNGDEVLDLLSAALEQFSRMV